MKTITTLSLFALGCFLTPNLVALTYNVLPGEAGQFQTCIINPNGHTPINEPVALLVTPPGIGSGGHTHDFLGRPNYVNLTLGSNSGRTGGDGCFYTDLLVPYYSGTYGVTVYSTCCVPVHNTFIVSVGGLVALTTQFGGLYKSIDNGHINQWACKLNTCAKIAAVGANWALHGSSLYGPIIMTRGTLQDGGILDSHPPFSYWSWIPDGHMNGISYDFVNMFAPNIGAGEVTLYNAFAIGCGSLTSPNALLGIETGQLATSHTWHLTCN